MNALEVRILLLSPPNDEPKPLRQSISQPRYRKCLAPQLLPVAITVPQLDSLPPPM